MDSLTHCGCCGEELNFTIGNNAVRSRFFWVVTGGCFLSLSLSLSRSRGDASRSPVVLSSSSVLLKLPQNRPRWSDTSDPPNIVTSAPIAEGRDAVRRRKNAAGSRSDGQQPDFPARNVTAHCPRPSPRGVAVKKKKWSVRFFFFFCLFVFPLHPLPAPRGTKCAFMKHNLRREVETGGQRGVLYVAAFLAESPASFPKSSSWGPPRSRRALTERPPTPPWSPGPAAPTSPPPSPSTPGTFWEGYAATWSTSSPTSGF